MAKVAGNSVAVKQPRKKGFSKPDAIRRAVRSEMPGWELVSSSNLADQLVVSSDAVGAGTARLTRKYGAVGLKRPKKGKNGSIVRLRPKGSADDARSTKSALVHDGKILGLQG
jgi:hypothetical protein